METKTISLMLPMRMNSVNCFLLRTDTGWILIDTACSNRRSELAGHMEAAGCGPGELKLILLTHGDFDHCGNARYLRERFASRIAMHRDDLGMVERGDMFWNRGKGNVLARTLAPLLFGFRPSDRFSPDLYVEDGYDLGEYGANLKVVHLPGHTRGSVGILTESGDLFCGDLLINERKPILNYRIADPAAARASVEKLKSLNVRNILPSHGAQFRLEDLAAV